jgi:hypothetical protein
VLKASFSGKRADFPRRFRRAPLLVVPALLFSAACQWLGGYEDFSGPAAEPLRGPSGGEAGESQLPLGGAGAGQAGAGGTESGGAMSAGSGPLAGSTTTLGGGGNRGDGGGGGAAAGTGGGVATAALEIDDFEDGDTFPSSKLFAQWQCYTWGQATNGSGCDLLEPGFNSNLAQFVLFQLHDPPNGHGDSVGAGLRTTTVAGTVDLSAHVTFGVTAKLEGEAPDGLPAGTPVNVRIGCSGVSSGLPPPGGFAIFSPINAKASWTVFSLKLSDFTPGVGGDPFLASDCLKLVDGLDFQIVPTLEDAGKASGRLQIDNVYFQ